MFTLRPYQQESVDRAVRFMTAPIDKNGLLILPTGSGKSLIVAGIATRLNAPTLVLQPSKELLQQNFSKMIHYGLKPAVFSASLGKKQVSGAVTMATIGSIAKKAEQFDHVEHVLIDECHLVGAKEGMYKSFFEQLPRPPRIVGLTATPYRLTSTSEGPILKFLTRTRPRIFDEVVHYVQTAQLFRDGHLAKLKYYQIRAIDHSKLKSNSTGADYTDESVQAHFRELNFAGKLERVVLRLLEIGRTGILVFTRFLDEAEHLASRIPGAVTVSAKTPYFERDRILKQFKSGNIRVVANVGVLTTGFDYPELDTVVLARPTMSLQLYYQMVGRCIRPHPNKEYGMVVDMVGLMEQFGKVEDLHIERDGGKWFISSGGRQLTNVIFGQGRF